jgi:hypothetical protein
VEDSAPDSVPAPDADVLAEMTRSEGTVSEPRVVPVKNATVRQWADIWVAMCADGDFAVGPLNDDDYAEATFGVSSRQLRLIRTAVTSGALARRATELGVELPARFTEIVPERVNADQLDRIAR